MKMIKNESLGFIFNMMASRIRSLINEKTTKQNNNNH